MRKLALGVVAAAALSLQPCRRWRSSASTLGRAALASAWAGPYWADYPYGGYYDYYGGPGVRVAPGWRYGHWHHWRHW